MSAVNFRGAARPLLLLLAILAAAGPAGAQQPVVDETPVAAAGAAAIARKEFLMRYEFTPAFQRHAAGKTEENKQTFLLSLVAEKLLSQEALRRGIASDSMFRNALTGVERLLVRDELYTQQVRNAVTLDPGEIRAAVALSRKRLTLLMLRMETRDAAEFLAGRLASGMRMEDLHSVDSTGRMFEGPDTLEIRWGDGNPAVEERCYRLRPGEITPPVEYEEGWYILKLIGMSAVSEGEREGSEDERGRVERILRTRKEEQRTTEYLASVMNARAAEADRVLLRRIVDALCIAAGEDSAARGGKEFVLRDAALTRLHQLLHEIWNETFISFSDCRWTAGEALVRVRESGFGVPSPVRLNCRRHLNERLKNLIMQEELTAQAYRDGLHNAPDVRWKRAMWNDAYLAAFLRQAAADTMTIGLADLVQYANTMADDSARMPVVLLNVFASDSVAPAAAVAEGLKRGECFENACAPHAAGNKAAPVRAFKGYIPADELDDVRDAVLRLRPGEFTGPVHSRWGYLVIQMMDRRSLAVSSKDPELPSSGPMRERVLFRRKKMTVDQLTAALADQAGVSINHRLLSSTPVTKHPALFFRMLGFGGRMLAVPLIKPDVDWLLYCKKQPTVLP